MVNLEKEVDNDTNNARMNTIIQTGILVYRL